MLSLVGQVIAEVAGNQTVLGSRSWAILAQALAVGLQVLPWGPGYWGATSLSCIVTVTVCYQKLDAQQVVRVGWTMDEGQPGVMLVTDMQSAQLRHLQLPVRSKVDCA